MITYGLGTIEQIENAVAVGVKCGDANMYNAVPKRFLDENKSGKMKTFFAFDDGAVVGGVTLVVDDESSQTHWQKDLAGGSVANVCALRVKKENEGTGIASGLMKFIEKWAGENGIKTLTIGVEPHIVRNIQIYFHWGFTEFIKVGQEQENGKTVPVLYYKKTVNL